MRRHVTGMARACSCGRVFLFPERFGIQPSRYCRRRRKSSDIIQVPSRRSRLRDIGAPRCASARRGSRHHHRRYQQQVSLLHRRPEPGDALWHRRRRDGFGWSGVVKVGRKAEWPSWTAAGRDARARRERMAASCDHAARRHRQSARRPRALSLQGGRDTDLPHPRDQPALDHRSNMSSAASG